MKHTKEPWRIREFPDGSDLFITSDEKSNKVAYGIEILGEDYTGFGDDERRKADFYRAVACVNACARLTTEALENGIIEDAISILCQRGLNVSHEGNRSLYDGVRIFEEEER